MRPLGRRATFPGPPQLIDERCGSDHVSPPSDEYDWNIESWIVRIIMSSRPSGSSATLGSIAPRLILDDSGNGYFGDISGSGTSSSFVRFHVSPPSVDTTHSPTKRCTAAYRHTGTTMFPLLVTIAPWSIPT